MSIAIIADVERTHASEPQPDTTAVVYLRVSTKEQAERGGFEEGFSIPAQRQATWGKADDLGARVVEEFVDPGETAKNARRPELQRMLAYVKANRVSYCIVHKLDRLARNREDDVAIHLALRQAGVMLVSVTENIDETPSGCWCTASCPRSRSSTRATSLVRWPRACDRRPRQEAPSPKHRWATSTPASAT